MVICVLLAGAKSDQAPAVDLNLMGLIVVLW